VLFIVTAITTTFVGALYANEKYEGWLTFFLSGWVFSVPLMSILLVHEMGHYLTGRRRFMDVTPPYFIPAPPPLAHIPHALTLVWVIFVSRCLG
jgi:hypothetical protein